MNEHDLIRSIGDLDEKLLQRFDREVALEARRAARRRRLIVDLVLLLLLAVGALCLILGRSPTAAEQNSEAHTSEAAAPEPLPFSQPEHLRLLPAPWYNINFAVTIDFDLYCSLPESDMSQILEDYRSQYVEDQIRTQAEKDQIFPFFGALPAPIRDKRCDLQKEGVGLLLNGGFYREVPNPAYDCGWRVDLRAFAPLGTDQCGNAVYGCPAGKKQPSLLLLEAPNGKAASRKWYYCPALLELELPSLELSDFTVVGDSALAERLWETHVDPEESGVQLRELRPISSMDQKSLFLVRRDLPCLSYCISYVRLMGAQQAFVWNPVQQRDLYFEEPTAVYIRESENTMLDALISEFRLRPGAALPKLVPHSEAAQFDDPTLQSLFTEATAGLDLKNSSDAILFFEKLRRPMIDNTRYFYHQEMWLQSLCSYSDGVLEAHFSGNRRVGMVLEYSNVWVSQKDGHLICMTDQRGLIDPADLDRDWVSGADLELNEAKSSLIQSRREEGLVWYDCELCIWNPLDEALTVLVYGCYEGNYEQATPRMSGCLLTEDDRRQRQSAAEEISLQPGENLLRIRFVDPSGSTGTRRHSALPALQYYVVNAPEGVESYGPEPFLSSSPGRLCPASRGGLVPCSGGWRSSAGGSAYG